MTTKEHPAQVTDLVATLESETFQAASGPMTWATVEICYRWNELDPKVTIKVPVPVYDSQSDEQRREEALRRARKLIDHACSAVGSTPTAAFSLFETLEGLAEEFGVVPPKASSNL